MPPRNNNLLSWAGFALAGLVGILVGQAVADLPFAQSLLVAATFGAVVGGAYAAFVAFVRRKRD